MAGKAPDHKEEASKNRTEGRKRKEAAGFLKFSRKAEASREKKKGKKDRGLLVWAFGPICCRKKQ